MEIEQLIKEKEMKIVTAKDREKIELIKCIIIEKDWMFKHSLETVIGMLEFLDVPVEKMEDLYLSLISPENFLEKHPKEHI